eukprot:10845673-Karenia_brevis.AAC.1
MRGRPLCRGGACVKLPAVLRLILILPVDAIGAINLCRDCEFLASTRRSINFKSDAMTGGDKVAL